jgi:hypothetical protein
MNVYSVNDNRKLYAYVDLTRDPTQGVNSNSNNIDLIKNLISLRSDRNNDYNFDIVVYSLKTMSATKDRLKQEKIAFANLNTPDNAGVNHIILRTDKSNLPRENKDHWKNFQLNKKNVAPKQIVLFHDNTELMQDLRNLGGTAFSLGAGNSQAIGKFTEYLKG